MNAQSVGTLSYGGQGGEERRPLVPNSVMAMLMFTFTEVMLFTGLISAHVVFVANQVGEFWPPPGQPLLPYATTALNSSALLLSGVSLLLAQFSFRSDRGRARLLLGISVLLGIYFVGSQGVEWMALIREGLTMTSSAYGAFFYLIVGAHALHAIVAIGCLLWAWVAMQRGGLEAHHFLSVQIFWYFVVLIWPVIFLQVYRI